MNNKITPCLWFTKEAEEVAQFYVSVFNNSELVNINKMPNTEEVLTADFKLFEQDFLALNGKSGIGFNPSVSFIVNCESRAEVDLYWGKLSDGGKTLMPLDEYPFSKRYSWLEDKFGVSWQLIWSNPEGDWRPKIIPSLMFVDDRNGKARAAIEYYTQVFKNSGKGRVETYGPEYKTDEGNVMYADFKLSGHWFAIMESSQSHDFEFNDSISFQVECKDQEEVDYFWEKLTANGGNESMCGWLHDRYGLSWQITPEILPKLIQNEDSVKAGKAMQAMMKMKKIIIKDIIDSQK